MEYLKAGFWVDLIMYSTVECSNHLAYLNTQNSLAHSSSKAGGFHEGAVCRDGNLHKGSTSCPGIKTNNLLFAGATP